MNPNRAIYSGNIVYIYIYSKRKMFICWSIGYNFSYKMAGLTSFNLISEARVKDIQMNSI